MSIDKVGRDLSKPIPPMNIGDWEDLQIEGEAAMLGASPSGKSVDDQVKDLGKAILSLSAEVFRLRLTYGEEVWKSVYHTDEEDAEMRRAHEIQNKNVYRT